MAGDSNVSFTDYLEAKLPLDAGSVHPPTFRAFLEQLPGDGRLCVDLGTGTGGAIRRTIEHLRHGSYRFLGLDSQPTYTCLAERFTRDTLRRLGFVTGPPPRLVAGRPDLERPECEIEIEYAHGDVLDANVQERVQALEPATITAHALMDSLPVNATIAAIRTMLVPGGHFYASLNYDGRTDLFPAFADGPLESAILARYNASMDERTVRDRPIAGSRSGRVLIGHLPRHGFEVVSFGAAVWSLSPENGTYPPHVRTVLDALLGMIHSEMIVQIDRGAATFDREQLDAWLHDRARRVEAGGLTVIVHHLDVLARRR
ncbi:MAG: hypothetical protein ACLFUA_12430 [Spirochaetales bacterium]